MISTEEFLNILKTDDKKVYKLGKIDPNYASGDPRILFDGETTVSVKKYKTINYSPFANDRVLLVNIADTYLVLGRVGSYSSTGERGPGITNIADNGDGTLTITYGDGLTLTTSDITGPQGPQGIQGPPGIDGTGGGGSGMFAFEIINGDLILMYPDEDTVAPNFQIDTNGNLIYTI